MMVGNTHQLEFGGKRCLQMDPQGIHHRRAFRDERLESRHARHHRLEKQDAAIPVSRMTFEVGRAGNYDLWFLPVMLL